MSHSYRSSTALFQPSFGQFDGFHDRHSLIDRFLPFGRRIGIGHDAGSGLEMDPAVLDDQGAYRDAQIHIAGEREVADRASIDFTPDRLQFVDDLHGPDLGGSGKSSGRERAPYQVEGVALLFKFTPYIGNDVHD